MSGIAAVYLHITAVVFAWALTLTTAPALGQTPEPAEDIKRGDVSTESNPNLGRQKSREEVANAGEQKSDQQNSRAGAEGGTATSSTRPQPVERPHRFERPLRPERPHR